jgi:hypothetical protein
LSDAGPRLLNLPAPRRIARSRFAATVASLTVIAIVAGCDLLAQPAEPPREPTAVGVVESMDPITSRVSAVHLANGETVRLDYDQTRELYGSGPNPGALLIYGEQPSPWRASLQRYPHGPGFEVFSQPDDSADGSITLDFGVRLPLADGYIDAGHGQLEEGAPVVYVVNEEGEVIARP